MLGRGAEDRRAGLVLGVLVAGATLAIVVGAAGASSSAAYSHVVW